MQLSHLLLAAPALALAHPHPHNNNTAPGPSCDGSDHNKNANSSSSATAITAATIAAIAPLSVSCDGRGDECANATLAAPFLAASLDDYAVESAYERAGVLALIAYESVELQYRTNQNAEQKMLGRGTANEQGGTFNVEYANTFPELAALNLTTSTVLEQVTKDEYNFATGAWYYSQQTTDACVNARAAAKQSNTTAWEWFSTVYLFDCVGVNITAQTGRTTYWNNALAVFGITNETTNSAA